MKNLIIILLFLVSFKCLGQSVLGKKDSIQIEKLKQVLNKKKANRQEFKAFVIGMVVVGILTNKVVSRK